MMTQLIHGNDVFAELSEQWDALAGRGMTNTPFQKLAYQESWWKHLRPPNSSLHTVVSRARDGQPSAIGCFYLTDEGILHFNGCIEETDYLDLITPAEGAADAWDAVVDCLMSEEFPTWKQLDLCNVPAASPTRKILARLTSRYGLQFEESIYEVCPIIQLPDSFETYLGNLESKHRREIRRKLRRATGAQATLRVVGPDDDLRANVDDFLELLGKSTLEKRDWLNQERREVFHATAAAAQADGSLQLMFLDIAGRPAATLFNFDYKDRIWVYNSGLDPENFSALSLGVVLTANAIELAIENSRREFDFLRGSETYKYHFGAEDTLIYRIQVSSKHTHHEH